MNLTVGQDPEISAYSMSDDSMTQPLNAFTETQTYLGASFLRTLSFIQQVNQQLSDDTISLDPKVPKYLDHGEKVAGEHRNANEADRLGAALTKLGQSTQMNGIDLDDLRNLLKDALSEWTSLEAELEGTKEELRIAKLRKAQVFETCEQLMRENDELKQQNDALGLLLEESLESQDRQEENPELRRLEAVNSQLQWHNDTLMHKVRRLEEGQQATDQRLNYAQSLGATIMSKKSDLMLPHLSDHPSQSTLAVAENHLHHGSSLEILVTKRAYKPARSLELLTG